MAGAFYLIRYNVPGPRLYHERLTTGERGALSYIMTPGFDDYDQGNFPNADIAEVTRLAGQGAAPATVAGAHIHRFRRLPIAAEAWAAVGRGVAAGFPAPGGQVVNLELAAGNVLGVARQSSQRAGRSACALGLR